MSEELKSPENSTKPCIYCGSSIPLSAKLCSVCKSYQSKLRNNLVYFAGIAGLISLLGSAFVYIVSELPNLRKVIAWHDQVKIGSFGATDTRNFSIAATNIGDGAVILVSIEVYFENGDNAGYPIEK
jgi:hypothetical protein